MSFKSCNLKKADLHDRDLTRSIFEDADLSEKKLAVAMIINAFVFNADLSEQMSEQISRTPRMIISPYLIVSLFPAYLRIASFWCVLPRFQLLCSVHLGSARVGSIRLSACMSLFPRPRQCVAFAGLYDRHVPRMLVCCAFATNVR